jgi:tRNA pseudouridine55 synthase
MDLKRYEAAVRLGPATDTYDRLGEPVGPATTPRVARRDVEAALERFRGSIEQTPPAYSAKKIGGESAYKLARRGEPVPLAPVKVQVLRLDLIDMDEAAGRVTLAIECSAGFYVRSLAHDLGAALGCGGHLAALRRTASGDWTLDHAVTLEACERDPEGARARIVPMSNLLTWMPSVRLTTEGVNRVRHGQPLRPGDYLPATAPASVEPIAHNPKPKASAADDATALAPPPAPLIRLLAADSALIALAQPGPGGLLHPALVLV